MIKTSNILVRKPDRGLNNLQVRKPTMSRLLLKVGARRKSRSFLTFSIQSWEQGDKVDHFLSFPNYVFSRLLGLTQSLVRQTFEECRTKTWKLNFNERSLEKQA